jgi:hypothetical protein
MKSSKKNPWAAMDAMINANPEPMEEEWFTIAEYCKRYPCTADSARHKLIRLRENGLVEQWKGSGKTGIISKWRAKSFP